MEDRQFLGVIRKVLRLEALDPTANAGQIEAISIAEISRLQQSRLEVNRKLYEFLDDFDIRAKDVAYRRSQTRQVLEILKLSGRAD